MPPQLSWPWERVRQHGCSRQLFARGSSSAGPERYVYIPFQAHQGLHNRRQMMELGVLMSLALDRTLVAHRRYMPTIHDTLYKTEYNVSAKRPPGRRKNERVPEANWSSFEEYFDVAALRAAVSFKYADEVPVPHGVALPPGELLSQHLNEVYTAAFASVRTYFRIDFVWADSPRPGQHSFLNLSRMASKWNASGRILAPRLSHVFLEHIFDTAASPLEECAWQIVRSAVRPPPSLSDLAASVVGMLGGAGNFDAVHMRLGDNYCLDPFGDSAAQIKQRCAFKVSFEHDEQGRLRRAMDSATTLKARATAYANLSAILRLGSRLSADGGRLSADLSPMRTPLPLFVLTNNAAEAAQTLGRVCALRPCRFLGELLPDVEATAGRRGSSWTGILEALVAVHANRFVPCKFSSMSEMVVVTRHAGGGSVAIDEWRRWTCHLHNQLTAGCYVGEQACAAVAPDRPVVDL